MSLLDLFRKSPPIRETGELAQFMDANACFVAQKGVYEYSRARAGHYSKVLFTEPTFIEAIDRSRWRAYPLTLAMVGELVEGKLRHHGDAAASEFQAAIAALALSAFDQNPVPAVLGEREWGAARDELASRLGQFGLHPPKRAMDIPEPMAKAYFDLMPIHQKLRANEFPAIHNYLRLALCNIHIELTKRLDEPALIRSLRGRPSHP